MSEHIPLPLLSIYIAHFSTLLTASIIYERPRVGWIGNTLELTLVQVSKLFFQ
jgi:hypothetical protein